MIFYDFEVFKHDWMVCIVDTNTRKAQSFINDNEGFKSFYEKNKYEIWVGFNSRHYDQFILRAVILDLDLKELNDFIIKKRVPGWKFSQLFYKAQLFNYDAKLSRDKSLKQLEAFMGHDIQETSVPFDIDRKLTAQELKDVEKYCLHDVYETIEVFMKESTEFNSHLALIQEFNLPIKHISKTQAQLAAIILDAKKQQDLEDDYDIILPTTLDIKKYSYVVDYFKSYTKDICKELKTDIADVKHVFAAGGVHGAKKNYNHTCQSDELIIMADVDQLYPTMMIEYDLLSRGVSRPEKFEKILETSLKLKSEGRKKEREPYKRICNITYGAEGDKFNPMFDARNRLLVCVYGQLFMLDLIEKLEAITSFELIQSNTDGVLIKIKEKDFDVLDDIVFEWENRTGLHMSFDFYQKVIQKDVNNYLIIDEEGNYKSTGAYVKKLSDLDYDLAIVNKAVVNYFVHNIPVENTIMQCQNLIEFQKVVKLTSKFEYATYNRKKQTEKVFRVFASNNEKDGELRKVKKTDDKLSSQKIANTPLNCFIDNSDITAKKIPKDLDKKWYIKLAKKRIKDFEGGK
ncbi:hypothetical protein AJN15_06385 [Listeria monocytogenes]|uniref:hypothetical protein n=1 Tax=Listeria monocytogenes TaxID=1639 RepID=UPI00086D0546|nr:hypothetical protein [Listeria monocytogenes]EAG6798072.1 hypothetical protein [Listeria monocytogenes]OEQ27148.1 hypothetical protein AJN15_06385 [Listeria monocytogenes]